MTRLLVTLGLLSTLVLGPMPPSRAAPPAAMLPAATVSLPNGTESVGSAAVAFDGEVFYYLSGDNRRQIDRLRLTGIAPALTALALPSLRLGLDAFRMAYDARHRALLIEEGVEADEHHTLYRYDLRTGRTARLFTVFDETKAGTAYDWRTDRITLLGFQQLVSYDARGARHTCSRPTAGNVTFSEYPSALVGDGAGSLYEQAEDDITLYRVRLDCGGDLEYAHRLIDEATPEDDGLACDGATLGTPVLWLRDTTTTTMTAYALPSGDCLLPTALSLTANRTRACAVLRRAEVVVPLVGQPVSLSVDGHPAGTAPTDPAGVACVAVSLPVGRHVVSATYAGSRSWASSSARTTVGVVAPPRPRAPGPVRRRLAEPYRGAAPVPQAGVAAAPPAVAPAVGTQAAAQSGYGNAAVAQALPVALPVPDPRQQADVVYAMSDANADRRRSSLPAAQLLAAAVISAVAAVVRRRQEATARARSWS